MLYNKQLSNEEPSWNKENFHREHQVFLSAKVLKDIDVFV